MTTITVEELEVASIARKQARRPLAEAEKTLWADLAGVVGGGETLAA